MPVTTRPFLTPGTPEFDSDLRWLERQLGLPPHAADPFPITEDMVRQFAESPLGRLLAKYADGGTLVPD